VGRVVSGSVEVDARLAEWRRRARALDQLLPTLSAALDVREVFSQVSRVAQEVVPHDLLALGLVTPDGQRVRIYALSTSALQPPAAEFEIAGDVRETLEGEGLLVSHLVLDPGQGIARGRLHAPDRSSWREVAIPLDPVREKLATLFGIRSQLRVPVRLTGETLGALLFNSREDDPYTELDVEAARRIADHVALALAHQRLAEERERAARERERNVRLAARVARLTEELEARSAVRAIGVSPAWKDVLAQAARVAGTDTTVLLTGESGTGKEVVARFLHRASPRADGPFVALNCAALPDQLLESELFGHERGAFTGATATKPGRLEQAAGGVLFLDEVGEMTPLLQVKLLRVLQEREFQRLGATRTLRADVRVVAATNRDLQAAIAQGTFREDLYYRLHVFGITLPPLRERRDDIVPLAEAFLREIGQAVGRPAAGLSRDACELLMAHRWPGNVRELRNAIERAVILCEGGLVAREHLPIALASPVPAAPAPAVLPAGGLDMDQLERQLVLQALERAQQNKSRAARLLGITRAQLYTRLARYGLEPRDS
jgi:transcriptional regulator with GAF, ATPase, and Fis domain